MDVQKTELTQSLKFAAFITRIQETSLSIAEKKTKKKNTHNKKIVALLL